MSIIFNKWNLLKENQGLRQDALEILEAGYAAIDTEKILRSKITLEEDQTICIQNTGFQCNFYERIFFIGIGKCAFDGARVIEDILGDRLTDGVVIDVRAGILKKIRSYQGTHPYPSEINISATRQILQMIKGATERDLVLVLISGGGSALLCLPHDMNCDTLVNITKALTKRGADIYELNTVRKHFSEIQGGGLAKLCYPAQVVSLIFSDVLGNDLGMIASGPTVYDQTTVADAAKVLLKYDVLNVCIPSNCQFLETPKHPKYFTNVKNTLVCSNREALLAMKARAEELGFDASIETETLSGDAAEVGKNLATKPAQKKKCLLFGGETTVKVKGRGVGGRNQELVLSALPHLNPGAVLVAASSDGWDNTDHAGALADTYILEEAKRLKISPEEYLKNNDSYNFFKKVHGAICTGRLGSNVSDLYILIYE